jgi:hypothetical protein
MRRSSVLKAHHEVGFSLAKCTPPKKIQLAKHPEGSSKVIERPEDWRMKTEPQATKEPPRTGKQKSREMVKMRFSQNWEHSDSKRIDGCQTIPWLASDFYTFCDYVMSTAEVGDEIRASPENCRVPRAPQEFGEQPPCSAMTRGHRATEAVSVTPMALSRSKISPCQRPNRVMSMLPSTTWLEAVVLLRIND